MWQLTMQDSRQRYWPGQKPEGREPTWNIHGEEEQGMKCGQMALVGEKEVAMMSEEGQRVRSLIYHCNNFGFHYERNGEP